MVEGSSADEPENDDQPEEFMNRAARRAQGKKQGHGGATAQADNRAHGRDVVQNRRQFGTRRTGG